MEQGKIITILILAFKRKEFIQEAMESAINQSYPRDKYEVICSVGFHDKQLSAFMREHNIKEIYCDGTIGDSLREGLNASRGQIVAFLDDDDIFERDKLEKMVSKFDSYPDCVYYHNNVSLINVSSSAIIEIPDPYNKQITRSFIWYPMRGYRKILRQRGDFNMSSIAVNRETLLRYIDVFSQISTSQDSIIFFLLLQLKSPFYLDKSPTTKYRLHDSETNAVSPQKDASRRMEVSLRFYNSRKRGYDGIKSGRVQRTFLGYILDSKFGCYIAGCKNLKPTYKERVQLLVLGLTRPSRFYLRLWIASLIYEVFPKFVTNTRDKRERRRYSKVSSNERR